jgi:YbgC/YbaW family acyl-CoA thioester hydrolase
MPYEFTTSRQVEFADTDMAGIVHFSAFFRYMEAAEHAFYRSLGYSVHGVTGDHTYGWPRVHAECDFIASLRFEDTVEIHLLVSTKGESSIGYDFTFRKTGGQIVARGKLVVVHVIKDPVTGKMAKAPMIDPAPADKLAPAGVLRSP